MSPTDLGTPNQRARYFLIAKRGKNMKFHFDSYVKNWKKKKPTNATDMFEDESKTENEENTMDTEGPDKKKQKIDNSPDDELDENDIEDKIRETTLPGKCTPLPFLHVFFKILLFCIHFSVFGFVSVLFPYFYDFRIFSNKISDIGPFFQKKMFGLT